MYCNHLYKSINSCKKVSLTFIEICIQWQLKVIVRIVFLDIVKIKLSNNMFKTKHSWFFFCINWINTQTHPFCICCKNTERYKFNVLFRCIIKCDDDVDTQSQVHGGSQASIKYSNDVTNEPNSTWIPFSDARCLTIVQNYAFTFKIHKSTALFFF